MSGEFIWRVLAAGGRGVGKNQNLFVFLRFLMVFCREIPNSQNPETFVFPTFSGEKMAIWALGYSYFQVDRFRK